MAKKKTTEGKWKCPYCDHTGEDSKKGRNRHLSVHHQKEWKRDKPKDFAEYEENKRARESRGTGTGTGKRGRKSAWIIRRTETVSNTISVEIDLLREIIGMPKEQLVKLSMAIAQELGESNREADKDADKQADKQDE